MKKKESLLNKAKMASGRTCICASCPFRTMMLDFEGCKQCQKHFIEAYQKGYRQAKRDLKN
jgi:hypothetical protein